MWLFDVTAKIMQRMPSSIRNNPPLSTWASLVLSHQLAPTAVYVVILLKGFLIVLLDGHLPDGLLWADCYVPGRVQLGSRMTKASKYIFFYVFAYHVITRMRLRVPAGHPVMQFVNFVLLKHGDVERWSRETSLQLRELDQHHQRGAGPANGAPGEPGAPGPNVRPTGALSPAASGGAKQAGQTRRSSRANSAAYNTFMRARYFENPFESNGAVLMRPHRDLHNWWLLRVVASTVCMYTCMSSLLVIAIDATLVLPLLLTGRGFESVYRSCAAWVGRLGPEGLASYAHVHRPVRLSGGPATKPGELPVLLPYAGLQPFSLYQVARVGADVAENLFCMVDIMVGYAAHGLALALIVTDVTLYAGRLEAKLSLINDAFERRRHLEECYRQRRQGAPGPDEPGEERTRDSRAALDVPEGVYVPAGEPGRGRGPLARPYPRVYYEQQVAEAQALLLDYFRTITAYADSVNSIMFCDLFLLFVHTSAVYFFWFSDSGLISAEGKQVQMELLLLFIGAVIFNCLLLALASLVESRSRRLYRLMATSMALDFGVHSTKRRWTQLVHFYQPRQLYCFKLLSYESVSFLFMLKISSWAFSAFLVVKSLNAT